MQLHNFQLGLSGDEIFHLDPSHTHTHTHTLRIGRIVANKIRSYRYRAKFVGVVYFLMNLRVFTIRCEKIQMAEDKCRR